VTAPSLEGLYKLEEGLTIVTLCSRWTASNRKGRIEQPKMMTVIPKLDSKRKISRHQVSHYFMHNKAFQQFWKYSVLLTNKKWTGTRQHPWDQDPSS